MRKIAVITGTRAEYGLLYWIIKDIREDPDLELQLIVTGMHLSPEFDLTVREIEKDNFPIAERVEMLLSSDTEMAISTSMGLGIIGFARGYERLKPDVIVVLGDRFEILAAVSAAIPFRIPIAHIHGGEITEGAMDDSIRHAITKMSHIHFTATESYRMRVIQIGEAPERVFCYGAPGLDNINKLSLIDRNELIRALKLPEGRNYGVVTYHSITLKKNPSEGRMGELFAALLEFPEIFWVFTMPNADTGSRTLMGEIKGFVENHLDETRFFTSLGQVRYLSLLKFASVMVGNSSSGLIEAPSFGLPVVNIGDRQKGRIRAENVIDVPECERNEIINAINEAISPGFRSRIKGIKNPYGEGGASERILRTLKTLPLNEGLIKKGFYDIDFVNEIDLTVRGHVNY